MKTILFFVSIFFSVVEATDLLFISNKNEVPGFNTFYEITNINTNKIQTTMLNKKLDSSRNYLSDSCICQDNYYAIWDDISTYDWGLTKISLTDNTNIELPKTTHFLHSLSCGKNDSTLLAIGNIPGFNLQFNVLSIDIETGRESILYTFNNTQGNLFDTQFSYVSSLDEYWITISENLPRGTIKNSFYQLNMNTLEINSFMIDTTFLHSKNIFVYYTSKIQDKNIILLYDYEASKFYGTYFEINNGIEINKNVKEINELNTFGVNIPIDKDNLMYFINVDENIISVVDKNFETIYKYTFDTLNIPNKLVGGLCVKN